ncbi:MAG: PEP-CTERM sorting domain-containing protein [Burkholderiaceae bacterium]|nr:PEP-CTERM sorting domain-containing protein [Burkholderiaceae bacterium]
MMKPAIRALLAGAALAAWLPNAMATVLSFDDLAQDGTLPVSYGGLDWSAAGWTVFSTPADPYTPKSGNGRVATGFLAADAASLIRFVKPGTFDGAYFAGLGGATLSFELFLNGAKVHSSTVLDPSATPSFLASGYAGLIDAVVVKSANHGEFAMDDFTFTQAVPEPQTYALLIGGLFVVGHIARRRQSNTNEA